MNDIAGAPFSVLLCTDDSPAAEAAERWVARLRPRRPLVVDVLCVAGHGITRLSWGLQTYRAEVRQAVEQLRQAEVLAAERVANTVGERLQRAGVMTRVWARQGDAVDEILAMVDASRPDLVALGPRGRSGLATLLLGSVSHQVIVASSQPVLVTRKPDGEGTLPRHVMVALDGTDASRAALDWLLDTGLARQSSVTLLGLLVGPRGLGPDRATEMPGLPEDLRAAAVNALDEMAEACRGQCASIDVALEVGHPIEGALQAVRDLGPDLVVVARPPRRRGQDPSAEKIARYAPASVIVVPRA